jgi:hypothetical protein
VGVPTTAQATNSTETHPPARNDPVALAKRSTEADAEAARKHHAHSNPLCSFTGLLNHLATLTCN